MYAIIDLKGHQYIVKKGDTITVDNVEGDAGTEIKLENILATFDEKGEKVSVGKPTIKGTITAIIKETKKGDKVKVVKFKRKNRYERNRGFRPLQTLLEIKEIKVHE